MRGLLGVGAAALLLVAALVVWLGRDEPVGVDPQPVGAAGRTDFTRTSSAPAPLILERLPRRGLGGRVLRRGAGVRSAKVLARSERLVEERTTDDSGAFAFEELPAGQYLLSATSGDEASPVVGPVMLWGDRPAPPVELELMAAGSVSGVVLDTVSRRPVEGALVRSSGGAATTDHAGRFALKGLPRGETWLEASAKGYVGRVEWLVVQVARAHSGMELFLRPAAVVRGTVVRLGRPVAGGTVWAEQGGVGASGRTFGPVQTSADGRFELWTEGGLVQLAASTARGGRIEGPRLRVGEGSTHDGVVLELGQELSLSGVVLLDGRPLEGAEVLAVDARSQKVAQATVSAGGGLFRFDSIAPGSYLVQVKRGELQAQRGPFEFTGEPGESWTVDIAGGRALFGRVEPARAGVLVRWRSVDWVGPAAHQVTAADGRFRFDAVPPGPLDVEAEGEPGGARVRVHDEAEVVLRLRPGRVTGLVVDAAGRPVTDFVVRLRAKAGASSRSFPVLSASGEFSLQALPGVYEVSATAPGYGETAEPRHVDVGPQTPHVRLALMAASEVNGIVRDAASGAPLAGVEVGVHRMGKDRARYSGRMATVTTGPDGRFQVAGLPQSVLVSFRRDGYTTAWVAPDRLPRDAQGLQEVRLATGHPDARRVLTDYEGIGAQLDQPAQGAPVVVRHVFDGSPAESAGLLADDVVLAVDGRSVVGVPVNQVINLIVGPAGSVVRLTVRRGAQNVDLWIRRQWIQF